jgi:hypothetical protein
MLAACHDGRAHLGERVFVELLPAEWQPLANRIYGALRDGLAHGFDTKHLLVDDLEHQIYLDSRGRQGIYIVKNARGIGLSIGLRTIAEGMCAKIDQIESLLERDEDMRQRFLQARQKTVILNAKEAEVWRVLVAAAGIR